MTSRLHPWLASAAGWLPKGHLLSDAQWPSRHRAMVWVLWLHLPALGLLGLVGGRSLGHMSVDLIALALGAAVASSAAFSRRVRTLTAVVTLTTCSAVLVHLSDGLVASHFHFFAVVAFITLYQEWLPFAVALGSVVAHHGLLGVFFPTAVYNHQAAWERPVLWAFIHGGFVVLASLASLAAWRLAEVEREKVERVLDAADDGIYGVDARGRITFVNPMLCELTGEGRDSLEGADHHQALGHCLPTGVAVEPADCPLCTTTGEEGRATGEACLQGVGDAVEVEYVTRPTRTSLHGRGSVITVRDLRERRAMEMQRRRVEAERDQLASIAEAAPDLTLVGRTDGRLVWMNSAGRTMLGFDPNEDMGQYRIEDLFSAQEMARVYAEDMPDLARDGDWQGEWALQARDGTQVPVWVTQHLHHDAQGGRTYVTGIMRDLRPQRAEERERRESARRLAAAG
jgi:PAS domain S-box-containing protein